MTVGSSSSPPSIKEFALLGFLTVAALALVSCSGTTRTSGTASSSNGAAGTTGGSAGTGGSGGVTAGGTTGGSGGGTTSGSGGNGTGSGSGSGGTSGGGTSSGGATGSGGSGGTGSGGSGGSSGGANTGPVSIQAFSTPENIGPGSPHGTILSTILDGMGNVDVAEWGKPGLDPIFYMDILRVAAGGAAATSTSLPGLGRDIRVAGDSSGNIYAAWTNGNQAEKYSGIMFSRSTDGGVNFSNPQPLSATGSSPNLAVDSGGNVFVVWADGMIFLSRSGPRADQFSTPLALSDPSKTASTPEIAIASNGTVDVFWQYANQSLSQCDIWFSHSTDGGQTFSAAVNISNSSACATLTGRAHQFQIDSQNNVNIAWNDSAQGMMFRRSADGGATFSPATNITPNQGFSPKITVDLTANINVVWDRPLGTTGDGFFFSRSIDGGPHFSHPVAMGSVRQGTAVTLNPAIATDAAGDIDLVWDDTPYLRFSQSFDGGQTFSPPITVNSSYDNWGAEAGAADLAVEPNGDVDLVWAAMFRGGDAVYAWFSRGVPSNIAPPAPLTFTACCGSGYVGNAFTAYLRESGGTPPYSVNITGLPPGLFPDSSTSSSRILGTPTTAGTFRVIFTIQDAAGISLTSSLDVTISGTYSSGLFNIGNQSTGVQTDTGDSSRITMSRMMTGAAGGGVPDVYIYIASPVDPAPNNQFAIALYRDDNGKPGALMAVSNAQPILPDTWNHVYFGTAVLPNTAYWLAYQTNGLSPSSNNVRFTTVGQSAWVDNVPFGSWPAAFHPSGQSNCTISAFFTVQALAPVTFDGGGAGNLQVGYNLDPGPGVGSSYTFYIDSGDSNRVTASRIGNAPSTYYDGQSLQPANGEAVSATVYLAPGSSPSPNNQLQLALYSDNNGSPGTLIATSSTAVNSGAGAWITVPLLAPIQAGSAFWLAYNTNGTSASLNDIRIMNPPLSSADQKPNYTEWGPSQFGTWPTTVPPVATASGVMSIYLNYIPKATPPQ